MNQFLFVFVLGLFGSLQAQQSPLVILPTAIRWNAVNTITVIPTDWSFGTLDIIIAVYGKDKGYEKEELYREARQVTATGAPEDFMFNTFQKPDSVDYEIQVNVTKHNPYSTILFGAPNIKLISVETDKGYYSPGENVNLRILPVTESGDIYGFELKASLVNTKGFKVITDVLKPSNRYISHSFTIPEFAENGTWIINVAPLNLTLPWMASQTRILVQRYTLPKFLMTMNVRDSESQVDTAIVEIYARYPNGALVTGAGVVSCTNKCEQKNFEVGLVLQ